MITRLASVAMMAVLGSALPASATTGPKFSLLNIFNQTNGNAPYGALMRDATGNLYGVTNAGGTHSTSCPGYAPSDPQGNSHVVLPPVGKTAWREVILHSFDYFGSDGFAPESELVRDPKGTLYGTTITGANKGNPNLSYGTVFN